MTLRILDEFVQGIDKDSMVIKSSLLSEKGTHLFIASNKWDEIRVKLNTDMQPLWLHYFPTVCKNIKVEEVSNYSQYLSQLVELYPELSGKLRRAILQGDNVTDILGDNIVCKA